MLFTVLPMFRTTREAMTLCGWFTVASMRCLMRASRTLFRRDRSSHASIGRFGNLLMASHSSNASDPMIIFFMCSKINREAVFSFKARDDIEVAHRVKLFSTEQNKASFWVERASRKHSVWCHFVNGHNVRDSIACRRVLNHHGSPNMFVGYFHFSNWPESPRCDSSPVMPQCCLLRAASSGCLADGARWQLQGRRLSD